MQISDVVRHFAPFRGSSAPATQGADSTEAYAGPAPSGLLSSPSLLRRASNAVLATAGKDDPDVTFAPLLKQINDLEPTLRAMSDHQLAHQTELFKDRLQQGAKTEDLLPEAFATVREAARRTTGMRPFDVQMQGAIVMARGNIAEMRTGEGKTLAISMPAYLRALDGQGSHVFTVNETLVQRDAENMGRIYQALGLTVGAVVDSMSTDEKRKAYDCDITYLTPSQAGFDYMRDNSTRDLSQVVQQREPHSALVDEVDEILIDEARTPLILSTQGKAPTDSFQTFAQVVKALAPERDYVVDEEKQTVAPTDAGYDRIQQLMGLVQGLRPEQDYRIDAEHEMRLSPGLGLARVQDRLGAHALAPQQGFTLNDKGDARLTEAGLQTVGERLGVDMFAPCDPGAVLDEVRRLQVDGSPANVQFASQDEARPFLQRLREDGVAFQEGKPGEKLHQDLSVVGVLYPGAPRSAPGTGRTPAVTLQSSDFNHAELIPYSTACLKAQALFDKDRDYVVAERPTWKTLRTRMAQLSETPRNQAELADAQRRYRLEAVYLQLSPEQQLHLENQAVDNARAVAQRFLANDQDVLHTTSGEILGYWESSLPPQARTPGHPMTIPGPVVQAVREEQRLDLLSQLDKGLSADQRQAVADRVQQPMGTDPLSRVQIVDAYTGRIQADRRYSDGVHQAIEAKEGVAVQRETRTMSQITLRNLLQRYQHVGAMTGTGKTEEKEFQQLCGMMVTPIRPNRPSQRIDKADVIFSTEAEKLDWLAEQAADAFRRGQPVLIGTPSIELNRKLEALLTAQGVPHQVLNAQDVKQNTGMENAILARAGQSGAVTVATDMAGRGVDIRPDLVSYKRLAETAQAQAAAQQPVGIVLSDAAEADKVRCWLANKAAPVAAAAPDSDLSRLQPGHITLLYPGATPLANPGSGKLACMLNKADFPSGGLLVLGAERHDARRIDNQLMGRSGRQGEPGTTQFAVSLEDELIRNFAGEKLQNWLKKHGVSHSADGVAAKAIEKAQESVQNIHYGDRETSAKYEESLNIQRDIIYDDHRKVVGGYDSKPDVLVWADARVDELASPFHPHGDRISGVDAAALTHSVHEFFGLPEAEPGTTRGRVPYSATIEQLRNDIRQAYAERETSLGGADVMRTYTSNAFMDALDDEWSVHLDVMSDIQSAIGYRSLAQTDPVYAFKTEASHQFDALKEAVKTRTLESVFRPGVS